MTPIIKSTLVVLIVALLSSCSTKEEKVLVFSKTEGFRHQSIATGIETIKELASNDSLVIPGHDPLLKDFFPSEGNSGFVWRLDKGPIKPIKF